MTEPTNLSKYRQVDNDLFWYWYKRIAPEQMEDFKMKEQGIKVQYFISKKFLKDFDTGLV